MVIMTFKSIKLTLEPYQSFSENDACVQSTVAATGHVSTKNRGERGFRNSVT